MKSQNKRSHKKARKRKVKINNKSQVLKRSFNNKSLRRCTKFYILKILLNKKGSKMKAKVKKKVNPNLNLNKKKASLIYAKKQ